MTERVGQQLGHDDPNILTAFCHAPSPACYDGEISCRADRSCIHTLHARGHRGKAHPTWQAWACRQWATTARHGGHLRSGPQPLAAQVAATLHRALAAGQNRRKATSRWHWLEHGAYDMSMLPHWAHHARPAAFGAVRASTGPLERRSRTRP